jgi:hypothetical protein
MALASGRLRHNSALELHRKGTPTAALQDRISYDLRHFIRYNGRHGHNLYSYRPTDGKATDISEQELSQASLARRGRLRDGVLPVRVGHLVGVEVRAIVEQVKKTSISCLCSDNQAFTG